MRPDPASVRVLMERAGDLPDPISRALAGATAWDMLMKAETRAADVVGTLSRALVTETSPIVVESFLALATRAAEQWAPLDEVPGLVAEVASTAAGLTAQQEFRQPALRTLAATATTDAHFATLRGPAETDRDLAWRVLARRAELGDYDEAAVTSLQDADLDPEAWVRALGVRAARPDEASKDEAWQAMLVDRKVPAGTPLVQMGGLFWRPTQADLLKPYTDRYLDLLPALSGGGLLMAGSLIRAMFPLAVADQDFLDRALKIAETPGAHPAVRQNLLIGIDTVTRILAARVAAAARRSALGRGLSRPRRAGAGPTRRWGTAARAAGRSPPRPGRRTAGAAGSAGSAARGAPGWRCSRGARRAGAR